MEATKPKIPKRKVEERIVPEIPYTMIKTNMGWMMTIGKSGTPFPATDIEVNMWLEIVRLKKLLNLVDDVGISEKKK